MPRSARTALVLGRNALATDVASGLAASAEFGRVVTVAIGDSGSRAADVRCSERIDPNLRGAGRELLGLLEATSPALVVHLAVSESPVHPARPWLFDARVASVLATALRGAASRSIAPSSLLMLSSTAVYGVSRRRSPLLFDEDAATELGRTAADPSDRWAAALAEAEVSVAEAVRDAGWRGTVLRAAPVVGGPVTSPMADYLAAEYPVRALGYDPLVQVLHYDDLVDAFVLAARTAGTGVFNVVAPGAVPLSRLTTLAGAAAAPLPGPLADRLVPASFGPARLRCRAVCDGRRAEAAFGFVPTHDVEEAVRGER